MKSITVAALYATFCFAQRSGSEPKLLTNLEKVVVTLSTDRAQYLPTEVVAVLLRVKNPTQGAMCPLEPNCGAPAEPGIYEVEYRYGKVFTARFEVMDVQLGHQAVVKMPFNRRAKDSKKSWFSRTGVGSN